MKRSAALLLVAAWLCGCNSTQPTFNPLAPYGSSRVPPPSTNQLGAGAGYYQNSTVPRTAVPTIRANSGTPAASTAAPAAGGTLAASGTWKPAEGEAAPAPSGAGAAVAPASYAAPAGTPASASTGSAEGANTLKLKGMPVNDATSPASAEPATFQPTPSAIPIAPQATAAPQAAAAGSGVVVATARSSDAAAPAIAAASAPAAAGTVTVPPASTTTTPGAAPGQASLQWRAP